MPLRIQRAEATAAAVLAALHRRSAAAGFAHIFPPEASPPTWAEDLARWEYWLGPDHERGRRCFVAVDDTTTLGVVLSGPDADDVAVGHLARLYVEPAAWGQRIGAALYDAADADLRSRYPSATLWVLEGNTKARAWYERLGWHMTSARKTTWAPGGIDDVQYRIDY